MLQSQMFPCLGFVQSSHVYFPEQNEIEKDVSNRSSLMKMGKFICKRWNGVLIKHTHRRVYRRHFFLKAMNGIMNLVISKFNLPCSESTYLRQVK